MYNYSHAEGSNAVAYGQASHAEGYNNRAFAYQNKNNSYVKPYNIEVLSVSDGDVIILHLAKDLDLDDINSIRKEIQQYFPNNQVICANEHILQQITVLKQTKNPFLFLNLSEDLGEINMDWKDLVHK